MANKIKRVLMIAGLSLVLAAPMFSLPKVSDIIAKQDELQDFSSDFKATVVLSNRKADGTLKVYEMTMYRRDKDDSFLMFFRGPESEKGNGFLRVGDNMFMYRRNTRTFQIINRDEKIGGTDAKAGDFEKRKHSELYHAGTDDQGREILTEEMLGKIPVYRLVEIASVKDVTYPKQVVWVSRDNYLPLKVECYSQSGTLMQTVYYLKYTQIEGKYVALQNIFVDEFEKGNRTAMYITGISTTPLESAIFTKAYLESLSK